MPRFDLRIPTSKRKTRIAAVLLASFFVFPAFYWASHFLIRTPLSADSLFAVRTAAFYIALPCVPLLYLLALNTIIPGKRPFPLLEGLLGLIGLYLWGAPFMVITNLHIDDGLLGGIFSQGIDVFELAVLAPLMTFSITVYDATFPLPLISAVVLAASVNHVRTKEKPTPQTEQKGTSNA